MTPYICLMQYSPENLEDLLMKAISCNYNKIAVSLHNNELPHEFEKKPMCDEDVENVFPDLVLSGIRWMERTIVILPEYDCDSSDPKVRQASEKALIADLSLAEHLVNLNGILLRLKSGNIANLARIVRNERKWTFLVQVPLYTPSRDHAQWRFDKQEKYFDEDVVEEDSWEWWNTFRWINEFQVRLKVVLELHPDEVPPMDKVMRWLGEPLEAIILPSSMFSFDTMKKPFLKRQWLEVMAFFTRAQVNIIISAAPDDCKWIDYSDYILELQENFLGADGFNVKYGEEDELTVPLQTVHSNVNVALYEEFERDTMKYLLYLNAIADALIDRAQEISTPESVSVIMVLGAGRGPLIRCALMASEKTGRKVRIYAIEKNMEAVSTLKNIISKMWYDKDVHLIAGDMRDVTVNEKADILVSELLGSFGDNELSPECLACAINLLKPSGISIPNRSTSYINPIMAPKIHASIRDQNEAPSKFSKGFIHVESTFITLMRNAYHISDPKPLFRFIHPNRNGVDNSRYKVLHFKVKLDSVLTGLAGYFEANLYNKITLNIHPLYPTPALQSWFPIYFPFSYPMDVKAGDIIEIHFWRRSNSHKVWYEWCCMSPKKTHIHNFQGHWSPIFLQ